MSWKQVWQGFFLLVLLTGVVMPVEAANYAGVYQGRFVGGHKGTFALYVRPNNTGVVIAYDQTTNTGFADRKIRIQANGTFVVKNIGGTGTKVTGKVLRNGRIRGGYVTNVAVKGRFVAKRLPKAGPHRKHAGYYAGVFASSPGACAGLKGSGRAEAILAANGKIAIYTRVTRSNKPTLWPVGTQDIGIARVTPAGAVAGRLVGGARVKGKLKGRAVAGTFVEPAGCRGAFRLLKRR